MRRSQLHAGFTLIELLIAVALGAVILFVASNLMVSTSGSTTDLQARTEMLEESQIAQNYLASQLREAVYVYPVGSTLTLGTSGYSTVNPSNNSRTWTVGDGNAPILAFIRPPSRFGAACSDNNASYCYALMAYYPMLRSKWISGATGFNDPGPDANNANRWVLVEYRANFIAAPAAPTVATLLAQPIMGRTGRLLLDYVQPPTLALSGTPPLFQVRDLTQPPTPAWTQAPGNIAVDINLAVSRQVAGKVVTVPSRNAAATPADSVTTITVTPRNLGTLSP